METRSPIPLPTQLEGITHDWLEAALASRTPGLKLNGFSLVDVNHGTCTKVRLSLDVNEIGQAAGVPSSVILKGGFEPHTATMLYLHKQEVHAYADVAPHSPLRMPKCWFAAYDGKQGIVIMDDLVQRGATFLHPQRPEQPDAVAKRLVRLAQHHALRWNSPDLEPGGRYDWAPRVADKTHVPSQLKPDIWGGYVRSARGAAASAKFHDLDWMIGAIAKLARLEPTLDLTLVHGDTHLGNLYVDTDGEPGFFDSIPGIAPGISEVSYHVAGALDMAVRADHERSLVACYREELVRCGILPPSLDDLMHLYGCYLARGFAIFLINASEFQPEAINTAYTARFSAAMLDHDTMGLLARLTA